MAAWTITGFPQQRSQHRATHFVFPEQGILYWHDCRQRRNTGPKLRCPFSQKRHAFHAPPNGTAPFHTVNETRAARPRQRASPAKTDAAAAVVVPATSLLSPV